MDPDSIFKTPLPKNRNPLKRPPEFTALSDYKEKISKDLKNARFQEESAPGDVDGNDPEEDPRFYESGVDAKTQEIWDHVDTAEAVPDIIGPIEFKRNLSALDKCILENRKLRSKYPDEPLKFVDSEAALDECIRKLIKLWDKDLFPTLLELKVSETLATLLVHENIDICISTIDLINEIISEDTTNIEQRLDISNSLEFIVSLFDVGCFELLSQILYKLNEIETSGHREAVYSILDIFESSLSIYSELSVKIVESTEIMKWLVERIKAESFDTNLLYSMEIISILVLERRSNRLKLCSLNGVECILQIIGKYRKRDPTSQDEVELMNNSFDVLISLMYEPEAKVNFFNAEGTELMIILLSQMNMARLHATSLLDSALDGPIGLKPCTDIGESLIDSGGLKYIFPILMGSGSKRYAKKYKEFRERRDREQIVGILYSLCKHIKSHIYKERFIRKFCEKDNEKILKIMELYKSYSKSFSNSKQQLEEYIKKDEDEFREEEFVALSEKSDQFYDVVVKLAYIITHIYENISTFEEAPKEKTFNLLKENNLSLDEIKECSDDVSKDYIEDSEHTSSDKVNDTGEEVS